jgi:hypothetical protein
MHPPPFDPNHRLLDWPKCKIEFHCSCGMIAFYPTALLAHRHGNRTFRQILKRAKCSRYQSRPVAAWLCAGEKRTPEFGGGDPDWAIELVLKGGTQ